MEALVVFETVIRTATALLFLEAAAGKLSDRAGFEGVVANYRLLPELLVRPVAISLPVIELLLGLGLLSGALSPWTQLGSAALLGLFALAMALNLARGRSAVDCGCGRGGLSQPISWGRVVRNLVLALLLLVEAPNVAGGWTAWALGAAAGVGLFVLDYALSYLGALSPRRPEGRA